MRRSPSRVLTVLLAAFLLSTACTSQQSTTVNITAPPPSVGTTIGTSAVSTGPSSTSSGAPATTDGTSSATTSTSAGPLTDVPSYFVTRSGKQLMLNGKPFRFVGANLYDAAATEKYSCNPGRKLSDADLATTLAYLHDKAGVTVLRFWAYQTYTQGGTYFDGIDRVIAAAGKVGMKVLPVLEDGPGNCTTIDPAQPKSQYQSDTWYTAGYKVPFGNASLSYRDYVKLVVAHYADNPAIIAWSMMNEADTSARDSAGKTVLVDFAQDIAGVIRSVDSRHLITVGTQSNGAPGASGPDFTAVYGLPEIDLAEVHDWGYWGSDQSPMPGGSGATPPAADSATCRTTDAPVGCSFALVAALDKPLFVGEAGITGKTPEERTTRAAQLRAKMDAAFGAGAVGYLVWSINTGITDGYDILINDDDPLIGQLAEVAHQVGS